MVIALLVIVIVIGMWSEEVGGPGVWESSIIVVAELCDMCVGKSSAEKLPLILLMSIFVVFPVLFVSLWLRHGVGRL